MFYGCEIWGHENLEILEKKTPFEIAKVHYASQTQYTVGSSFWRKWGLPGIA